MAVRIFQTWRFRCSASLLSVRPFVSAPFVLSLLLSFATSFQRHCCHSKPPWFAVFSPMPSSSALQTRVCLRPGWLGTCWSHIGRRIDRLGDFFSVLCRIGLWIWTGWCERPRLQCLVVGQRIRQEYDPERSWHKIRTVEKLEKKLEEDAYSRPPRRFSWIFQVLTSSEEILERARNKRASDSSKIWSWQVVYTK